MTVKNGKLFLAAGLMFFLGSGFNFLSGSVIVGVTFAVIGCVYIAIFAYSFKQKHLDKHVEKIDFDKVNRDEKFIDLMRSNKKIAAIKQVRKLTACSLLAAKEYVETQEGRF